MSNSEVFHRYHVGDVEVTVVRDGHRTFPLPDHFVVNATKDDVNAALESASLLRDEMTIHFNPLALKIGGKTVVVDTGLGEAGKAMTNGTAGHFTDNLKASGIDPKQVDAVVISHFHFDHIAGLADAQNRSVFPNAEIFVPATEWSFWMDQSERSNAPEGRRDAFDAVWRIFDDMLKRKVTQYNWGDEVLPGLLAAETAGHTPGHTSFMLTSGADRLFIQSDVTNHPALFVRNPTWHAAFDMDAERAERTRRRVYDMLVSEKLKVQAFHYPFPSSGYIEKDGDRYHVLPGPGLKPIW
ncbi:MAG: MBL fold metallo-hydrolase [Xanthobacteraceae bacterium]|nr:MBL fold metallo-hydrolase [Xanthobacteraceae bacterium]